MLARFRRQVAATKRRDSSSDRAKLKTNDPLTLYQAADELGWDYATALRHFENVEGVIIKPGLKTRGRTRRIFKIPRTIFEIERAKLGKRTSINEIVEAANEKMRQLHFG